MKDINNIKGYIFDLDGVIVDTAKHHRNAWSQIASTFDVEITDEVNEKLKGVGREESLNVILRLAKVDLKEDKKNRLLSQKNDIYQKLVANLNATDILPDILDFVREAKQDEMKIALGSASKNAVLILEKLGMVSLFDVIIDGRYPKKSKPNPEVFLMGADRLKIDPSQLVVFEDAKSGVEAANAGGFISVGIGEYEYLNAADVVVPDFKKLTQKKLVDLLKK